ncbi:MAG: hypothetical protein HYS27_06005 [Deltaproteobacteria bacterium]|nr:hypothetical protein [Deltaproteobacteria bacterium]
MPALVVTLLLVHSLTGVDHLATAPRVADEDPFSFPGLFEGRANPLADYQERQRCLSAAGVGLAGALVGGALFGGGVWLAGMATNKDADGNLVGAPDTTTQRFFVPGFAAGGAFLGGALASLGTYGLVEPDDRPGVTR